MKTKSSLLLTKEDVRCAVSQWLKKQVENQLLKESDLGFLPDNIEVRIANESEYWIEVQSKNHEQ